MQPNTNPAAFTIDAAASYIGISRAGIYRAARRGELPLVRIGSRTLVRRADLDGLLNSGVGRAGAGHDARAKRTVSIFD